MSKKIDSGLAFSIIIILAFLAGALILWEADKDAFPAEQIAPLNVWANR